MDDQGLHPWDRQPGEPAKWFDRWDRYYRAQGPGRTFLRAYVAAYSQRTGTPVDQLRGKRMPRPTGAWKRCFVRYDWEARANAWDEYQVDQRRGAEQQEAEEDRKTRIALFKALRGRIAKELTKRVGDMDGMPGAKWSEIVRAAAIINEGLRQEYGQLEPKVADALNAAAVGRTVVIISDAQRQAAVENPPADLPDPRDFVVVKGKGGGGADNPV